MLGDESKPQHFLATMVDITDRKRAEAASRDSLTGIAGDFTRDRDVRPGGPDGDRKT
jgi:hypothetical protein